jgi:hypothetical protein
MSFDTLREQLLNNNWIFVVPKFEEKFMLNTFDDGNEAYTQYFNEWVVFGEWKEKKALFNYHQPDIIISSISDWKITAM